MPRDRETKRARTEETNLMELKTDSLKQTSIKNEHESLKPPETQCGIKYKGGYGPPPRWTEEEDAYFAKINDLMAAAGLDLLNKRMTNGVHYELVMSHHAPFFRTSEGWRFHTNFVAKNSDDPNAENRLFFLNLKIAHIDYDVVDDSVSRYEAIDCINLGPVHTDYERCSSCEICEKLDISCPNFHPLDPSVVHSCALCDQMDPADAIFHPSGLKVDHLLYKRQTSRVT